MTPEQTEMYQLHAKVDRQYKRRVEESIAIIHDGLSRMEKPYVGFSRGKDSTALLHLVKSISPEVAVLSVVTDADLPDMVAYGERLMEAWGIEANWIRPQMSVFEILQIAKEKYGTIWGQANDARSLLDKVCFFDPLMDAARQMRLDGSFLGLRKEESRGRRANLNVRGAVYYHQGRDMWTCCPLMSWSRRDVMAYLVSHDIPIGPVYSKTRFHRAPDDIREGWYVPGAYANFDGKAAWLKYYYPDLYRRLIEQFPEIANMT